MSIDALLPHRDNQRPYGRRRGGLERANGPRVKRVRVRNPERQIKAVEKRLRKALGKVRT